MEEKRIIELAKEFIKNNKEEMISDLSSLVEIQSFRGVEKEKMPYGEGPRRALDKAMQIAERMGFHPYEFEGRVGWFDLPGEIEEHIATVTHLDVVPAGEGWHFDPYKLKKINNWVVGRGTDDDKGPLIYCMYLPKFFKENGIKLKYTLRTLMGCDEETGMSDIKSYLRKYREPLFCLSSDALFPVCNGEKGLMEGEFNIRLPESGLTELKSGVAGNMIPEKAYCIFKGEKNIPIDNNINIAFMNGNTKISAYGTGAHCAMPERGVSAVRILMEYLLKTGLAEGELKAIAEFLLRLHKYPYGEGLGIDSEDKLFGRLTCAGGILRTEEDVLRQSINIRYPASITGSKITKKLADAAEGINGEFRIISSSEPFYISNEDKVIKTLMDSYRDITGDMSKAYTWGGGTYARCFKRAVSFGPGLSGEEDIPEGIGYCHGSDEGTNLETLDTSFLVYVLSLLRLQELSCEELRGEI